jgi:hypothetical protein
MNIAVTYTQPINFLNFFLFQTEECRNDFKQVITSLFKLDLSSIQLWVDKTIKGQPISGPTIGQVSKGTG